MFELITPKASVDTSIFFSSWVFVLNWAIWASRGETVFIPWNFDLVCLIRCHWESLSSSWGLRGFTSADLTLPDVIAYLSASDGKIWGQESHSSVFYWPGGPFNTRTKKKKTKTKPNEKSTPNFYEQRDVAAYIHLTFCLNIVFKRKKTQT